MPLKWSKVVSKPSHAHSQSIHHKPSCLRLSSSASSSSSTIVSNATPVNLSYTAFHDTTNTNTNNKQTEARSIVFLHGLLGNKRNFATLATSLAQIFPSDHIYSVDLRNHGHVHNFDDSTPMTYRAMAHDIHHWGNEVVDLHAQSSSVTLIGHSMGGKVAQAVALLYPEWVQGLVVLDMAPVAYCPEEDAHWKAVCDVIHLLHDSTSASSALPESKRELDRLLRPGIPDPALRAFCLTNWNERQRTWNVNLPVIAQHLDVLAGFDLSDDSGNAMNDDDDDDAASTPLQYTGDTLLIHGGQSRFVRHAYLPTIQSYFPNHMLTTIRGAGHWLHAEKPEDCLSLLQQYLERK